MNIDLEQLGRRIRRQREAHRWGQEELAERVGVSARTVGNWERGERFPRSHLGALEQVFGIDDLLADVIADDDVVAAIERTALSRSDKATLAGMYYGMLDRQGAQGA